MILENDPDKNLRKYLNNCLLLSVEIPKALNLLDLECCYNYLLSCHGTHTC